MHNENQLLDYGNELCKYKKNCSYLQFVYVLFPNFHWDLIVFIDNPVYVVMGLHPIYWLIIIVVCGKYDLTQIARFMVPTWGPSGADRTQVGPMLGPMNFAIWVYILGWGLLNLHQFIFLLVIFLVLQKKLLDHLNRFHIWQVSHQMWMWYSICVLIILKKIKEILTPLQVTAISASLRGIDLYFGNITKRHSP